MVPGSGTLLLSRGFVSLPKCLELALNNGFDSRTQKQVGPATGEASGFGSFEDVYDAFTKQVVFFVNLAAEAHNMSYALHPDLAPVPFHSALMNDCLDTGKDITRGGARYRFGVATVPHGYVNTANALTAMRKLVFEDRSISMSELLEALSVNFEGKEHLRQMLLAVPKYGNDDDYADDMVNRVFQTGKQAVSGCTNSWGDPLSWNCIGITAHYSFGKTTGALPDGRLAYTPLSDGSLSAFPGTDKRGPTAVIKSASKVDILEAMGTLLNLKFHPGALKGREGLQKFISFIKTYFDLNGYHIQFNVVDRETLLDARAHPEKYKDLVIRIAGFSMFWVDVPPDVQDEIIRRTEYGCF